MCILISLLRLVSVAALALLELSVVAADAGDHRPLIIVDQARTAYDITRCMPVEGFFDLRIKCDDDLLPEARTELLTQALADDRASRIKKLNLSYNGLITPPVLTHLTHLRKLDIDHNRLNQPPLVTGLRHLRVLYLNCNHLVMPPLLDGLDHLESLDLSYNELAVPPVLTELSRLKVLKLSYNHFEQPPVLAGLVNLRWLDLSHGQLTRPPVLADLRELKSIDLSHNKLTLPPDFAGLVNLGALYLDCNQLVKAPVLHGLAKLKALHLSFNQLTQPPVLRGLINLFKLDLSYNQLVQPPVLTGLINLEGVDLESNRLTACPVLTGLVRLSHLDLDNNQLMQPPVLTGLTQLTMLNLAHNQLIEPPVLTGLTQLMFLTLHHNYFTRLLSRLFSNRPVVIPLALVDRLDLDYLGAPYVIESQQQAIESTRLVDVATPGVDTVPFFLTQDTLARLPVPQRNPLTRAEILHTMNMVESWRYWCGRGMSAHDFDIRLREPEPVKIEEDIYTVTPSLARVFMRDRAIDDRSIESILAGFEGDEVRVVALLDQMNALRMRLPHGQSVDAFADVSEDLLNELCPVS